MGYGFELLGLVFKVTPLSHRPKQGANFAWGQQSGAWGRAVNANLLGVKANLLGVYLG